MEQHKALIMSIDPLEDPDDNHQKYVVTFEAAPGTDKVGLELAAAAEFEQRYGDLPIYSLRIL